MTNNVHVDNLARNIAETLEEANPHAILQIRKIIYLMGPDFVHEQLSRTQDSLAQGGMKTHDGDRDRTPGGVFFYLVRGAMTTEQQKQVWGARRRSKNKKPLKPFNQRLYERDIESLATRGRQGRTELVRIRIVGRPGKVIERENLVMTIMAGGNPPNLPRGVPEPPSNTVFLVHIGIKQWRKVASIMDDLEDKLIVEGYPGMDKRYSAVSIYAQSVTTVKQEEAKRQQKEAEAAEAA